MPFGFCLVAVAPTIVADVLVRCVQPLLPFAPEIIITRRGQLERTKECKSPMRTNTALKPLWPGAVCRRGRNPRAHAVQAIPLRPVRRVCRSRNMFTVPDSHRPTSTATGGSSASIEQNHCILLDSLQDLRFLLSASSVVVAPLGSITDAWIVLLTHVLKHLTAHTSVHITHSYDHAKKEKAWTAKGRLVPSPVPSGR